ncbi:MAG TPA: serine/threonine-protein kinase [Rudaea sp.]|nr:serine/threonine-protein kinase [Rudaea sp.]
MSDGANTPLFAPARWRELRVLIDRLEALAADARERELAALGARDAELAAAARDLLAEPMAAAAQPEHAVARLLDEIDAAIPGRIGPFQPVRRIGAGGMGTVWLAERRDADFVQRVALKLLDGDAARMAQLAARERRVLASLSHPNITAFVDAGTANGRAWLAMEYVDGEPLLAYCAAHALGARARVALFDQVCAAVAHAHAQLIVHRDLKPSNVLVAGDGTVKLLDFGIARVLDASDEQAPATRVFTPEYAAPEQLRGERATTTTDIYALGLLLYELVSGRRLPTLERGGGDPDWSTTALARHAAAPDAAPPSSAIDARQLRGDLGRIIAHTLAADPARRYGTVAQLRADLRRWLEHRPLTIARPSLRYVAARFVRRNRVAVAIVAIALLALIGTTAFALWQARQATRMAVRAEHSKTFLAGLLTDANPFQSAHGGKNNIALLDSAAQRIDKEFSDAPDQQVELRQIIADALSRLGEPKLANDLQRRSVEQIRQLHGERSPQLGVALGVLAQTAEDSGDIETARTQFEAAYTILQSTGDAYRRQRMTAMTGLAKMANRRSDFAEGQRWYERVLQERLAQEGPASQDIAMDLFNLGACALYQERYAQATDLMRRAHAMLEHTLGAAHPRFIYVDLGLGVAQMKSGHIDDAIKTLTDALNLAGANLKPGAEMVGTIQSALASAQWCAGDDAAAIASAQAAREILAAAHAPTLGVAELTLGRAQLRTHTPQALRTLADSRQHLRADSARAAGNAKFLALAQAAQGAALAQGGDAAQGEREARAARTNLLAVYPSGGEKLGEIDAYLADILAAQGKTGAAHDLRVEALATFQRVYGDAHPVTRALAQQIASR